MPYSLTWMPDVLLRAGLKVACVDGWQERGRGEIGPVRGVLCHHTAGHREGNMPALNTLIHGRHDLPGPLSQLGLGRDGTFYVVAAGRANHAGRGTWNGLLRGNQHLIGIEAENTGRANDPWPEVQLDAYRRGVAALLSHLQLPVLACAGHKEWAAGRKPDPSFDMAPFRTGVAALLMGRGEVRPSIPAHEPDQRKRPTLRRGAAHALVRELRERLCLSVNGEFDARLESEVRAFQRLHRLVPDGIVGPKTWAELDRSTSVTVPLPVAQPPLAAAPTEGSLS